MKSPSLSPSQFLNATQFRGLIRLGQAWIPGDQEYPSFEASGCAMEVDRVLAYMPKKDRTDLALLLGLLRWCPRWGLVVFLHVLEFSPKVPGPVGSALRFVRIGIKALIVTLYYSHPKIHACIGYEVDVYTGDLSQK